MQRDAQSKALILLVDDTPENLQVLGNLLEGHYKTAIAESGLQALAFVKKRIPDLILLDLLMPIMDGFEVCAHLKADSETRGIPIIFLTAKTDPNDIVKGFEVGGVDYITKPFRSQELLARVHTHILLHTLQVSLETQVRERTTDLSAANRDLEELIHILCHELRTPLGGIGRLVDWLLHEYAQTFDAQGTMYAKLLKNRAQRLYGILDGVASYTSLTCRHSEYELVNMSALLDAIVTQLVSPAHIKITIQENLPDIWSHREFVALIFKELIKNALDFMDKPNGQIMITWREDGEFWHFRIADNGPGIESKYYDKIFRLFESFALEEDSTHLGIGLALTKKIVERLQGKIGLESQIGKGATFYVALPKQTPTTDTQKRALMMAAQRP